MGIEFHVDGADGLVNSGAGTRSVSIDLNAFQDAILAKYPTVKAWLRSKGMPSVPTRREALKNGWARESSLIAIARSLGVDYHLLLRNANRPISAFDLPANYLRRLALQRILRRERATETDAADGAYSATNYFDVCRAIAGQSEMKNYEINDTIISHVCEKLSRDGWLIKKSDDSYRLRTPDPDELPRLCRLRVGVEMLCVRETFEWLEAATPGERKDWAAQIRHQVEESRQYLEQGMAFRHADLDIHESMGRKRDGRALIRCVAENFDFPFLKWRSLAKYVLGQGTEEYRAAMRGFNVQLLDDHVEMLEFLIAPGGPSLDQYEAWLRKHATRYEWLIKDSERLVAIIAKGTSSVAAGK